MNIRQLLGSHVNQDFVNAAAQEESRKSYDQGFKDYPSFDAAYYFDPDYTAGYSRAYEDDCDAREERRLTDERYPRSAEIDRRNGF